MATGFVGEAWVQITPSFTGFQNAVRKEITGAMPAAGRDAGAQLGKALVPSGEKAGKDAGAEAGKGFASKALGAGKDFAESVGRGMLQVTGQVARVGANLGGVATAGLVAFGVSSARAAMRVGELDVSMQAIGKSSGIGYEAMRRTTKEVRSQGIEMAAAQGIAIDFARANLDMADASKLARVAQDAAVIGQTNSTEATERLMHGITTLNPIVLRQLPGPPKSRAIDGPSPAAGALVWATLSETWSLVASLVPRSVPPPFVPGVSGVCPVPVS